MEAGLKEIKALPNVFGCFLTSNRGRTIAADPPLELTEEELESIGAAVIQVLLGLETWGSPAGELDFNYQRSRVVVRDLDQAALVMICSPEVDPAMLRLTVNVVTRRWQDESRVQDQLQEFSDERMVDLPDLFEQPGASEPAGAENQD